MDFKIKISLKLSSKRILHYFYIFFIILSIIIFSFVFYFLNKNVYEVIVASKEDLLIDQEMMDFLIVNIDIDKFEKIINNIEAKTILREIENFKNIFY